MHPEIAGELQCVGEVVMKFLSFAEIKERYGLTATQLRKYIKLEDEYFRAEQVAEVAEKVRATGWAPGLRKCGECGEWKERRAFYPMDPLCRLCRSKISEAVHGGRETIY